jgi:hypothetical protein
MITSKDALFLLNKTNEEYNNSSELTRWLQILEHEIEIAILKGETKVYLFKLNRLTINSLVKTLKEKPYYYDCHASDDTFVLNIK